MIYVHTYYIGKFNSVKRMVVYDKYKDAKAQMDVLGGEIQHYFKR